eukprot:TRINITY_DN23090_c0_g1_i1.p1 TRINITY_DN23090_c0_g1~~TRINITY_DN23090_c0_g1_i1.p1  ORF type:complete len:450 (-),score=34.87 TRINITY_DN23090_c0_g1_i1:42-1190(-)
MAYHVDVLVGTPGQMQSVIVDTGSGTTAFPCTGCSDCGEHLDSPFDPARSTSFSWVKCGGGCKVGSCSGSSGRCGYSVSYLEGSSIRGDYFEDVIHFGHAPRNNRRGRVWMGCHNLETNLFKTQTPSGIMGLGDRSTDIIQLLANGQLDKEVFSLCLNEHGGAMSLGGINESWTPLLSPLQWVSYSRSYYIAVTSIDLMKNGSAELVSNLQGSSFLVDSGSTYTYFTVDVASRLKLAVQRACSDASYCGAAVRHSSSCWRIEQEADLDLFPSLRISFLTATFDWKSRGYLRQSRSSNLWCYAFYGDPPMTFGASFLRHNVFVFDRDSKKIGFASAACPSMRSREDRIKADENSTVIEPNISSSSGLGWLRLVALVTLLAVVR